LGATVVRQGGAWRALIARILTLIVSRLAQRDVVIPGRNDRLALGDQIAAGERRTRPAGRVQFAVLADAPILVLDEVSSSVDSMTEQTAQPVPRDRFPGPREDSSL